MKLYKELNIFEDKSLYVIINIFSIIVLVITAFLVVLGNLLLFNNVELTVTFTTFIWSIVLFAVSLPIHELIHGLFFRIFSSEKQTKVKYGFHKGMFYASNPGVIYKKWQFSIIILAPFVINSLLFLQLYVSGIEGSIVALAFIIHTGGCAGDFWYIYEILKKHAITHCEDTPNRGEIFY